ncbi:thiamine pyrophosphate-requiring protein [Polymorphobacter megasporae]|nr:thiamine pyrophosphate-requiring protein [Polymorphobacter sp. PAMC 29334]UAJ10957.1 thiamine pyrophosphate-requiring protein [Polymorphobacter megasporae]
MGETVGDFVIERLGEWGVDLIFGYPGDGINGTFAALQRVNCPIKFVQVRHEEMAAFMASAYAKFTGRMGTCISTGGPGATHMITGLYDAKMDHSPVLAITGGAARGVRGAGYQQELNLDRIFADVAIFAQEAFVAEQVPHLLDRAIRVATAYKGVGVVVLPADLQTAAYRDPPRQHGFTRSSSGYSKPKVVPYDLDLQRAADILNAGTKVAILVGAGAIGAHDVLTEVADKLGAGVAKALLGKSALADDLPFVTGTIGLLGTKPSSDMMEACDTLLMIGTSFPWAEFLPKTGQARSVQIDISAHALGMRYPIDVPLHGDSIETLEALLPLLTRKEDRSWRQGVEKSVAEWWELMDKRAHAKATPVNPQRVVWELSPRLGADAIITSDSGSCANWYARDLRVKQGQMMSLSGGLASMGAAVPYAIAAKFAHPDRPVVALVGDGAMQMNNMAELITVQKYWREWTTPTWICCVFNNEDLNQVTWEQRVMLGSPRFDATQLIPNVPYAKFAASIGLNAIYVDNPEMLGAAWDEALACDRPTVIEVKTDPEVPPLPPHISFDQARTFMSTVLQGDSGGAHLVVESARQVLAGLLPGDRR